VPRRFSAPALPPAGDRVTLDAATSHHLLRVCLVPRGKPVVLFDGSGRECDGRLVDTDGDQAVIEATGPTRAAAASAPLVLLMGLPRKPAWERVLRMGTELGATRFLPFPAERSVARGLHAERWAKIVVGAAGQCGRGDRPTIEPRQNLAEALQALPDLPAYVLTPGAAPLAPTSEGAVLLIGPEGGLSPAEVDAAVAAGFVPAGLSGWTLRADTAAVAALAACGAATG